MKVLIGLLFLVRMVAGRPSHEFRIDFGSCNNVNLSQPLWPLIAERDPDFWIWGGDNIYADQRPRSLKEWLQACMDDPEYCAKFKHRFPPFLPWFGATPEKLRFLYNKQKQHPGYKKFVEQMGYERMGGIYDDHDFGINDGGGPSYEHRDASQRELLNFLNVSSEDPRRKRPGIYTTKLLADGRIKLYMLDIRYFRDEYTDREGDFLGEAQWKWLESELQASKAEINILVSGVQVFPESPVRSMAENWKKLPLARKKLFQVIFKTEAKGIMFLSGDVHYAEMMQANCTCGEDRFVIGEMTSSGMTHSWKTYHFTKTWLLETAQKILPFRYNIPGSYFLGINFGEIDFNFQQQTIQGTTFDINGAPVFTHAWQLSDLKPNKSMQNCKCLPYQGPNAAPIEYYSFYYPLWATALFLPVVAWLSCAHMLIKLVFSRQNNKAKTKQA